MLSKAADCAAYKQQHKYFLHGRKQVLVSGYSKNTKNYVVKIQSFADRPGYSYFYF
jgi:hypothetical protein